MWLNPQETADLVISTEEIRNGKIHFCAVEFADNLSTLDFFMASA